MSPEEIREHLIVDHEILLHPSAVETELGLTHAEEHRDEEFSHAHPDEYVEGEQ